MLKQILETKLEAIETHGIFEGFSAKNIQKVSALLASLFSEGMKVGPFYGEQSFKSSDGESGKGFQYLKANGDMLRFSFVKRGKESGKTLKGKFNVNRVDAWFINDKDAKFEKPSLTVKIPNWLNIVDVAKEISDALSSKQIGAIGESFENKKSMINEALSKKTLAYAQSKGFDVGNAKSDDTVWNRMKKQNLFDKAEYKAFEIVKGESEDNSIVESGKQADKKLAAVKFADPDVVFEDIEKLTKMVGLGFQKGLIVAGIAGIGKTFHSTKTLNDMFGEPNRKDSKWMSFKGAKASPFGLYKILFEGRDNKTILFDDSDGFLFDRDCVNMLKSAMDTSEPRNVSWTSTMTVNTNLMDNDERDEYMLKLMDAMGDPEKVTDVGTKIKLPSSFKFESQIIFITNLDGAKFEKNPDLNAIKSRSLFMDIQLRREDIIYRIKSLLPHIKSKDGSDIPLEEKEELLEAISKSDGKLTMRAIEAGINAKASRVTDTADTLRLIENYVS